MTTRCKFSVRQEMNRLRAKKATRLSLRLKKLLGDEGYEKLVRDLQEYNSKEEPDAT